MKFATELYKIIIIFFLFYYVMSTKCWNLRFAIIFK